MTDYEYSSYKIDQEILSSLPWHFLFIEIFHHEEEVEVTYKNNRAWLIAHSRYNSDTQTLGRGWGGALQAAHGSSERV